MDGQRNGHNESISKVLITWDFPGRAPTSFYRHVENLMGAGWLSNPANKLLSNTYLVYDVELSRKLAALVELQGGQARRFAVGADLTISDGAKFEHSLDEVTELMAKWSKRGPKPRPSGGG